jgi:glucuronoarabinoxylan endo-1,4-beta-xylanase
MSLKSIGVSPLLFALVACSQASPPPGGEQGGAGGAHAAGGSGGSVSTGGSAGTTSTGGGNATGGTTGGSSSGGTGGAVSGGAGGSVAGGSGGNQATGGRQAAGSGGSAVGGGMGGTGGMSMGMGGAVTSSGGASAGGAGRSAGGAGGGAGMGAGGSAGADTTGATTVQLTQLHQKIEGFGINDTYNAPVPSSIFDATKDIGLTILRVGMSPDGGFITSGASGDISMVKGVAGSKIIGSVWTAPANYKSNNNVNDGGHLNADKYTAWATAITTWAKNTGLYAMSVSNEPEFASCGSADPCNGNYPTMLYTANEMVAFIKVVGPMLQAAGIKVISGETSEWNHLWSNTSAGPDPGGHNSSDPLKCGFPPSNAVCDTGGGYDYGHYLAKDATAWAAFDIIGTHEYDSQHAYPWPSDVTAARKEVWQTEMSGVKWWPEQGPSSDINNGIAVATWIHEAMAIGDASAWLYWNYSQTGDNEGLVLGSTDTKRHWTLGNYSKFVRPGYSRVEVSGTIPANVLLTAYVGPDGTVVVVAINKNTSATSVPITIAGGTAPASMTPYVTSSSQNLIGGTAVPVSNGAFTMALGASTVTTFVGK